MSIKILTVFILLLCWHALLATGCSYPVKNLVIGAVPYKNTTDQIQKFDQIRKYLEEEMNVKIKMVGLENYLGLIDGMKQKKVDIGFYGPFSYIAGERDVDLDPLVMEYRKETGSTYFSYIITRKDSGIQSIEDLKGKKFSFVDPGSTSGYVIPFAMFESRDIDIVQYFNSIMFSGSHDKVALDVFNKKVDAGAMDDIVFNQMVNTNRINKDDFSVLWKSEAIPGSPYAARSDLDKRLKDSFKKAMLAIHDKSPEAVEIYDKEVERFTECNRSTYNGIRNIARILGEEFIIDKFLKKE